MTRVTIEEYKQLLNQGKKNKNNKYNAIKTTIDGIVFDSKAEAERYYDLKFLEKINVITGLKLQPKFLLQEKYKGNRAITYIGDFMYWDKATREQIVEDVKGFETREFKLKKKLFEVKYPNIKLIIIKN